MNGGGVPKDKDEAFTWKRKAAEKGHLQAMSDLSIFYEKGICVAQDYQEAFKWLLKSAEAGYALAMYKIAFLYYIGKGFRQDLDKAFDWYLKAADIGYAPAMDALGDYFRYGLGSTRVNYNHAKYWYERAVKADPNNEDYRRNLNQLLRG